jgi:excinuclease ABC subunit B
VENSGHLDKMHGPESLPYRLTRALPKKPSRDDTDDERESCVWQPTSSREAAGLSPPPRSTGGAPGRWGGWKKR